MNTMVDKLLESLNAEEDDRESSLEEFLEMWLKCEKDLWGGVIGWGEGRSCKQYLHSRALHERVRLEDFDEKGPGEEVFLLLHHNVHWVPARHQVSMGHTAAGPGFPRNPTKDFPGLHRCCQQIWVELGHNLMAKSNLERRKPSRPLRATSAAQIDVVPLRDLQDHDQPEEEL